MKMDHTQFDTLAAYADKHAVEDRIRRFAPLVRKAAWHVHGSASGILDINDLVQIGLMALLECARRHAGPGEDGFAAYAKMRVRGAMVDALRKAVPGSRGSAARRRRGEETLRTLTARLGREPTGAEMADKGGTAAARHGGGQVRLTSIDSTYDDNDPAFADERPDPFAMLSETEDLQRLTDAIGTLPERLQLVLQLYFTEELNLAEIAAVLEVSVPRIHQLKTQAIALVRKHLGEG